MSNFKPVYDMIAERISKIQEEILSLKSAEEETSGTIKSLTKVMIARKREEILFLVDVCRKLSGAETKELLGEIEFLKTIKEKF
jgi:prefoldin subunit 5